MAVFFLSVIKMLAWFMPLVFWALYYVPYVILALLVLCVCYVLHTDRGSLPSRLTHALGVYVQNPFFLAFFCVRAYFLVVAGNFLLLPITFLYVPCILFTGKVLFDWSMTNAGIQHAFTSFIAGDRMVRDYWDQNLRWLTWTFRGSYALMFMSGLFYAFLASEGMQLDMQNVQNVGWFPAGIEWSELTLTHCHMVGMFMMLFFSTGLLELVAKISVVHMLPLAVEQKALQTCRYCVDSTGTWVLVCSAAAWFAADMTIMTTDGPSPLDPVRHLRGLPVYQTNSAKFKYSQIEFLILSGEMDRALFTDPKTGCITDQLLDQHLTTTYKKLVKTKTPGLSSFYFPQNIVTKACSEMATDMTEWGAMKGAWLKKKVLFWRKSE